MGPSSHKGSGESDLSQGRVNQENLVIYHGQKSFHCTRCSNSFTSKISLVLHQILHTGLTLKPIQSGKKCRETSSWNQSSISDAVTREYTSFLKPRRLSSSQE